MKQIIKGFNSRDSILEEPVPVVYRAGGIPIIGFDKIYKASKASLLAIVSLESGSWENV